LSKQEKSSSKLDGSIRRVAVSLDLTLALGASVVMAAWLVGRPLLYTESAPVMSPFTAFSLLIMALVRMARLNLDTWPLTLSLAMFGLVLGGNLSSIMMLASLPPDLLLSFRGVVFTSSLTSVGLILFCAYDIFITLRETPRSALLLDDMLLHLALVPGSLSMMGYLLDNPVYLSIEQDPRVGISPLEMAFMGCYAVGAVISNRKLFLWRFLAAGWPNRVAFAVLFVNQFVAPMVVALLFRGSGNSADVGVELFVMLAGVGATLSFLLLQAHLQRGAP